MPGYFDEDEDQDQQSGPKALRDQLKKLEKQLSDLTKDLDTERKTNADLAGRLKSTSLNEAVRDAGIDVKYAKFVDLGDTEPSKDAVEKWAADNKDVYAFLNNVPTHEVEGEEDGPAVEDELPEGLREALQSAQRAEQSGRPSGSKDTLTQLEQIDPSKITNRVQLLELLEKMGAPLG